MSWLSIHSSLKDDGLFQIDVFAYRKNATPYENGIIGHYGSITKTAF
jgi:hypothetical protein